MLSLAGAIAADFEESKTGNQLHNLSREERAEILHELNAHRRARAARLRLLMVVSALVALVPVVGHEAGLDLRLLGWLAGRLL